MWGKGPANYFCLRPAYRYRDTAADGQKRQRQRVGEWALDAHCNPLRDKLNKLREQSEPHLIWMNLSTWNGAQTIYRHATTASHRLKRQSKCHTFELRYTGLFFFIPTSSSSSPLSFRWTNVLDKLFTEQFKLHSVKSGVRERAHVREFGGRTRTFEKNRIWITWQFQSSAAKRTEITFRLHLIGGKLLKNVDATRYVELFVSSFRI